MNSPHRNLLSNAVARARRTAMRSDLGWRFGLNPWAAISYLAAPRNLVNESRTVLNSLQRDGVAVSDIDRLLGSSQTLWSDIEIAATRLISGARKRIDQTRESLKQAVSEGSQKPYVINLLGDEFALDPDSIYARLALSQPVASIANAYFGLRCVLRHYNIWYNVASSNGPVQSQWWHRDPEDRYILKMFVYLSQVDEGAGPFTYARGTHMKGSNRNIPEYMHRDGNTARSNDVQMAAAVPRSGWVTATGKPNTVVFADTHGYHKGGLARDKDRVIYMCEFTSPRATPGAIPVIPIPRA